MIEKTHREMSLEERLDWCALSREERLRQAAPPFKLWCDRGTYRKSYHRTTFVVRESDALERELDSLSVVNQRHTAVQDGKVKHYYVWSCSCGKENCRHIGIAKRIYFAQWRKKKEDEAWLLANDPTYITAKMAAEGWISG